MSGSSNTKEIKIGSIWQYNSSGYYNWAPGTWVEVFDMSHKTGVYIVAVRDTGKKWTAMIEDDFRRQYSFVSDPLPKGISKDCPVIPKPVAKVASKIDFVGSNNLPIDLDYDDPWDNCVTYKRS